MPSRHDLSPLPPSSSFSQSTPALSHRPPYDHNASSSSPPNELIATPSDRYDSARGGSQKNGKQPQRRSARIRTSSGGNFDSSPQLGFGDSSSYLDEKPSMDELFDVNHFARPSSAMGRPRGASRQPSHNQSSDALSLAHANGLTLEQYEMARRQVMYLFRNDPSASQQQNFSHPYPTTVPSDSSHFADHPKQRQSIQRSNSSLIFPQPHEAGYVDSSDELQATTPSTSSFPYGQATIARTPNSSSALQRATFDAAQAELDSKKNGGSSTRIVRARPSFEDVVQRSAKRQMRGNDPLSNQVMQWAQEDETSSSEEDGPGLIGLLTASAQARRTGGGGGSPAGVTGSNSKLLPSPASFGGLAGSTNDVHQSPSLGQDGANRRGIMDRFMTDRPNAAFESQAEPGSPPRRTNYAQHLLASPAPSKPSQSVLFSPDVAKLLRSELDELKANEVAGRRKPSSPLKNIDRSSDIVVDSSPFRPNSPFGSSVSNRVRDVFTSEEPASKRTRWTHVVSTTDNGLASPTSSSASMPMRAPSFCDSSPPSSEHGSVTSRSQAFLSAPHPASAPDFLYGGVPSSSPTSSQHSEYLPARYSRSSPGPTSTTGGLARTDSAASVTSSAAPARPPPRAPAPRVNTAPQAGQGTLSHLKPTWSYAALIGQAIFSTEECKMSLADIYSYIMRSYPFYKKGDAGWQNSIRHNLSLNKCFVKTARGQHNPGKGHLWAIAPGCEDQFADGGFVKRVGQTNPRPSKSKAARQAASQGEASDTSMSAPGGSASRRQAQQQQQARADSPAGSTVSSRSSISAQGSRPAPSPLMIPTHMPPPPSIEFSPAVSVQSAASASVPSHLSPPPALQMPLSASVLEFNIPPPPLVPRPASAASIRQAVEPEPQPQEPKFAVQPRPGMSVLRSFSTADISHDVFENRNARPELPSMVRTASAPVLTTAAASVKSEEEENVRAEPASPTINRSTLQQLREPLLSSTMSPPTSVYHRLAGPYQPMYGASSLQNRRALALLASPEAAGIMPAIHPFDRGNSLLTGASQGSPRSSFLPSPHIFAGTGSKRSRAESDKEDRGFANLLSPSTLVHTQSPVSSVRGGPRAPMSPVQASADKLEPIADPEKKRAPGTRLLPSVNALVDASHDPFRSPPRHTRNRSPSGRSSLSSIAPLQAALHTPGKRPLGFSPSLSGGAWSSWNDPYGGGLDNELEHFTRHSARSPWPSPAARFNQW